MELFIRLDTHLLLDKSLQPKRLRTVLPTHYFPNFIVWSIHLYLKISKTLQYIKFNFNKDFKIFNLRPYCNKVCMI